MSGNTMQRVPILYLAPWVDFGGSDKNTIDWFRWIDRDRFAPSLVTTQPSPNRLVEEIEPFAEEVWVLPDLMAAEDMPKFILDFLHSREVKVLHLMNSRIGFDLLPDLACLPSPPAVVVQLHVEEADRSGYVRYVTTRYGNLVDRFSTSNEHVAGAVRGYGIPAEKVSVIYTGVDPDEEFSPDRTEPIEELPDDRLQILFAARLVAQKDPLLMVEVAEELRSRGAEFQIHVVGEGELEDDLRREIVAKDLGEHVLLHPPTPGLQRWYAACDVLLMTSTFEGIPVVVFEAMAMGLPVVAPNLPAIGELLGEDSDALVAPRDSVDGYASALAHLGADRDRTEAQGARMRARAQTQFTVRQMADRHGKLYDELVEARPTRAGDGDPPKATPIVFDSRPKSGTPLVSVLVPHFNQAQFLRECVESIQAQTYPEVEIIVIDDASTDLAADRALSSLEAEEGITVVRLDENGGPSRARNIGVKRCAGRFVLPVDSDNLLLPDAVEKLVRQLMAAEENVGFIYPNLQYFGNREDYYEVPEYNLYTLLHGNFCDTCSLLDREIFEAGVYYAENIKLGHEDWEFALRLASRGVRGEAAGGPTVRYRKWGFNRSDVVDHSPELFHELLDEISPFKGREEEIKAKESPALSVIPLRPVDLETDAGREAATSFKAQRCLDIELVDRFGGEWPAADEPPAIRRAPTKGSDDPFDVLRDAVHVSRGSFVAVTAGDGGSLFSDPAFSGKVLRRFATSPETGAIVLADGRPTAYLPFKPFSTDELPDLAPHTVIWRRTEEQHLPQGLHADPGDPVGSICRLLGGAACKVDWRHWPADDLTPGSPSGRWEPLPPSRLATEDRFGLHPGAQPLTPGSDGYDVPRWKDTPTWVPALSSLVIRYRERYGERRIVTSGPQPVGYIGEHNLGTLRSTGLEGTIRVAREGGRYIALPRGEWRKLSDDAEHLGYAELAPLPGLEALGRAVHRETGEELLVTMAEDPILGSVDVIETLGFIDPFPLKPRKVPTTQRPDGLLGLVATADLAARRFRYGIGEVPEGEPLGELGGLAESEMQGAIPAWIVDGRLLTDRHRPPEIASGAASAARWIAEPAAWRDLAPRSAQAKVAIRRLAVTTTRRSRPAAPPPEPDEEPAGWLFETERPGMAPLFAAYHPVTGDQLLSRAPDEAAHMGYVGPTLLGYLRLLAPLTGQLEQRHLPIPWARRFGAVPRSW
jgi:glycosyltransferase involved in cell wall biosynthesis